MGSKERVSSHGRSVIEHYGSVVERLEMSFYVKSFSHNTHCQFIIIKEKYNINEDVYTYHSWSHKLMFTQINAKKVIKLFVEIEIADMFK